MSLLHHQEKDLAALSRANKRRRLISRAGHDFSSNDYLGLAAAPELRAAFADALERGVPVGSGGSRLLRGNHEEHERLEAEASTFFNCQSALFFSSGYAANVALLSTLPQRGDLIIHDALIHASSREGIRLARADAASAVHNDANAVETAIGKWRRDGGTGRAWIAVESLYSMDGDLAPLDDLCAIAEREEAMLIIDEAHATGVFGATGRGLAAHLEGRHNIVTIRTCGKALGCEGALVCGPEVVRDFLVNRGRAFIFSTAPSPLIAAGIRAALRLVESEPERRHRLWKRIARAEEQLVPLGASKTGSQIMPLIIGDEKATMAAAAKLQQAGFDVRGIRPPTVPPGTSRLRISLTLNVDEQNIDALARALSDALG